MAKIIKRIEITHEVDTETNDTNCQRKVENFTFVELMGTLLYEAMNVYEESRAIDKSPKPESEVKPDEQPADTEQP